jgi:hypothetical protein
MGTTTLSGPIKAGTIQYTTGTSLGKNVANVGYGVCVQTDRISQANTSAKDLDIYLPENSEILLIEVCVEQPFLAGDSFDCGVTGDEDLLVDGFGSDTNIVSGIAYKPLYGQTTAPATAMTGNWIVDYNPNRMLVQNWYNVTTTSGISGDVRLNATYVPLDPSSPSSDGKLRLNVMYIPGRNASAPAAWEV